MTDKDVIIKYLRLFELDSYDHITEDMINEKYRKLAKKFHPDTCEDLYKDGKMFIELRKGKAFLLDNLEFINKYLNENIDFNENSFRNNEYIDVELYRNDIIDIVNDFIDSIKQNYSNANFNKIKNIQKNFISSISKQKTLHGIDTCTGIYMNQIDSINTKRRTSNNIFAIVGYAILYLIIILPCLIFKISPPKLKK